MSHESLLVGVASLATGTVVDQLVLGMPYRSLFRYLLSIMRLKPKGISKIGAIADVAVGWNT